MSVALPIMEPKPAAHSFGADGITGPRHISAVETLRISVTDRCNFRCIYCMPEEKLDWVPKDSLLSFEEIVIVARAALRHGIRGFKLTGGEPLVRHDFPRLVERLRSLSREVELSLTTNGALLDQFARELKAAGLDRITVSLDTQRPDRFSRITRGAELAAVLRGMDAAVRAGFNRPKINCVAMRGINDDEFAEFAAMTRNQDVTVRFIEYMPLGRTSLGGEYQSRFISESEIRNAIETVHGILTPAPRDAGRGPAQVYRVQGARGRIGFISAMSKPFCSTCNRLRLTAEGQLRSCLFDGGEVELRPMIREGSPSAVPSRLHEAFIRCVAFKPEVHSYFGNRQMSQMGG